MNPLGDRYRDELIKIESRVRGNYTFWMLSHGDRQRDIGFLKERIESSSYPSLRSIAQELLDFICEHERFVSTLKAGDPVIVMQRYDTCTKGMIGTYVSEGNPNESYIRVANTCPEERKVITRLLFPSKPIEAPPAAKPPWLTPLVETPSSSVSTEPSATQLVQDMLLEPNPKIEKEYHMGRPVGSKNKKTLEKEKKIPQTVVVPDQKKKRGRKPGSKNKPKQAPEQQVQEKPIVTPEPEKPVEAHVAEQQPPEPISIPEEPVASQVEVVEPAKEPSKAIMLYQQDHQEESFPIRNYQAFEPGFLFVKKEHGQRQIYIVTSASPVTDEKRRTFRYSMLNRADNTWVKGMQFMDYEKPKLFMKEEDMFFYLTPKEYRLVYTTRCLVGLPVVSSQSITEVFMINALFESRIIELLKQYASQHSGFSLKQDVLDTAAQLAKRHVLDYRNFESITQIVFNDTPAELENIQKQFARLLGEEAYRPIARTCILKVAEEVRQKERLHQMKKQMVQLSDRLQDLPANQLAILEERLKEVDNTG